MGMSPLNIVERMFTWWNEAFPAGALTDDGFALHFLPEAEFLVNGDLRGRGPAELSAGFMKARKMVRAVTLDMPLPGSFECDDRAFVHYHLTVTPIDGAPEVQDAKGLVVTSRGKIAHWAFNTCAAVR